MFLLPQILHIYIYRWIIPSTVYDLWGHVWSHNRHVFPCNCVHALELPHWEQRLSYDMCKRVLALCVICRVTHRIALYFRVTKMVCITSYLMQHSISHRIWLFHKMVRDSPWFKCAYQTPIPGMSMGVALGSYTRTITNSNETRTRLAFAVIVLYTNHIYINFAQRWRWLHLTTKSVLYD